MISGNYAERLTSHHGQAGQYQLDQNTTIIDCDESITPMRPIYTVPPLCKIPTLEESSKFCEKRTMKRALCGRKYRFHLICPKTQELVLGAAEMDDIDLL